MKTSLPGWKPETNCDSSFNFHCLAIQPVRLVTPLPNCVYRRVNQHSRTSYQVDFFDHAVFGNDDSEHNLALNALLGGLCGISGPNGVKDAATLG